MTDGPVGTMTIEGLRRKILNDLPKKTDMETMLFWHLKDQPEEFWQALHKSYQESYASAPATPGRSKAQP